MIKGTVRRGIGRDKPEGEEGIVTVNVVVHLNFRGEARAALTFYRSVFGGEVKIVSYGDMGAAHDRSEADQVMWGQVDADNGFRVMAFDVLSPRPWNPGENAFFVSLLGTATEEIVAYWEGLADGATILHPLGPVQWTPLYGMLKDKFGVTWVMDVPEPDAA